MHLYSVEFQWFSTRDVQGDWVAGMLQLREPGGRGLLQTRDYVEQKTLTPHDYGLDLWQAIPGVTEMSVAKQQHSY